MPTFSTQPTLVDRHARKVAEKSRYAKQLCWAHVCLAAAYTEHGSAAAAQPTR